MATETRNTKQVLLMTGFAFLAWLLVLTLTKFLLNHFSVFPATDNPWLGMIFHHIPNYVFGLSALLIVFRFIPDATDTRPKEKVRLIHAVVIIFGAYGLGTLINGIIMQNLLNWLSAYYPITIGTTDSHLDLSGLNGAFAGLFLGACVAGFGEELIFRKLLYKKMAGCPDILYIMVSGITFGIMHTYFTQGFGHIFVGMAFAYIYLRTKSYILVALIHLFIDTIPMFFTPLLEALAAHTAVIVLQFSYIAFIYVCMLIVIIWYRKKFNWNIQPATEAGWEFMSGKFPLWTMLKSPGIALFTVYCIGEMIYNLFH